MGTEIKNYKRKELFDMYHSRSNPFAIITTKMDITELYKLGKKYGTQYGVIAYYITKVVNEIDAFKMRFVDNKFVYYEKIEPNFTDMIDENLIGFFESKFSLDIDEFIDNYRKTKELFKTTKKNILSLDDGVIWLSCQPWYTFTSLIPPFDKSITVPQFIWDKFDMTDNKVTMNLMIIAHHGFVDGYQIGEFINKFKEEVDKINV